MQNSRIIQERSQFYIRSEPHDSCVEAWTAWHLPYMKRTPAQLRYRAGLRDAIKGLGAVGGVRATYTSDIDTPNLDTENVLIYNVGAAPFRDVATQILRFGRIHASPPPSPSLLASKFLHHVKYESATQRNFKGTELVHCLPVVLEGIRELRDKKRMARLWWLFKHRVVRAAGATWTAGDKFAVQLQISVPAKCRLNLADIVKPVIDGFLSAFHHYEGEQLNDVADRIAALLDQPVQDVRRLLRNEKNALLGPQALPHLRGKGLQWSPADHHLIAGEILCGRPTDDQRVKIGGCFFKPKRRSVSRPL